jgi:hypothetical protein
MEKTVTLLPAETQMISSFDQERQQALANYGALSMDLETARKAVESAVEKQRAFLRATLIAKGFDQYQNARLDQNNTVIVVQMPPEGMPTAGNIPLEPEVLQPRRPNSSSKLMDK